MIPIELLCFVPSSNPKVQVGYKVFWVPPLTFFTEDMAPENNRAELFYDGTQCKMHWGSLMDGQMQLPRICNKTEHLQLFAAERPTGAGWMG